MATTGSRTLKLAILAEVADFNKNLKTAGTSAESLGDQFTNFGKKAALAFAAAGAAIGAYAKAAIENAAADEAAQRKLTLTIQNTTNATAAQIAGVEDYISKTSLAIGVTDDQLRPAFSRLVRSTNDVEEAQKLLNLALDISSATGKPLEAVSNALGKAYDGNSQALGRLGLGLDANLLKSKDTDAIMNTLTKTFGNFAENEAQSTEKGLARIKIATDELNEQIGTALLPLVQQFTQYILTNVVPQLQAFVNGLTGKGGLSEGLSDAEKNAYEWGERIKGVIKTVISFKEEIIALGVVIGTVFVVSKVAAYVTATIAIIKTLITAYNALKASAIVTGVATAFALNPLLGVGAVALAAGVLAGANALANSSNASLDFDNTVASGGSNPIQSGTYLGGASGVSGAGGLNLGGLGLGGTGGGGGGGTGGGLAAVSKGGANAMDVIKDLTDISDALGKLTSDVEGNKIYKADAQKRLDAIIKSFDEVQQRAEVVTGNIVSSGMATNYGSFRLGEAQSMATYNITVNGAIDSEGTARTIVNTLNDSYYRGTSGAGALVGAFDK
jgi:hypothetical protein